jgi:RNA polymerase sigma-70 factor (ECF subfamily)
MNAAAEERDREDMARLVQGRDAALNDLMERHGQRLFHYLLRQLPNESDAEDCAQEAFVRVYIHRAKFRPEAKFSTWLYTIATNLARDAHRRRGRRKEVSLEAGADDESDGLMGRIPDRGQLPDEALITAEQARQVRDAIRALPEALRTPLVLFEYQDFSHSEIAAILKCSTKAVEVRIYRAKQALKKELMNRSVVPLF